MTPIRFALETAFSIFFYTFISAVIATGAVYPPTVGSVYGPLLVSLLAGGGAYAAARHIALPILPLVRPP
jgi:hypothetical protein